jgi:hypothetical protein
MLFNVFTLVGGRLALKRRLYLLELSLLVTLSVICYWIVYKLPPGFFPSLHEALYAKFLTSTLLGTAIGVSIVIAVELVAPFSLPRWLLLRPKTKKPITKVKPISETLPLKFISKYSRLHSLVKKLSMGVSKDVLEAGLALSPYRFMAKSLFYTLIGFMVTIPVAVVLSLLLHPTLLLITVVPVLTPVYPKLKLRSAVGERRRGLEDEAPFFTVYASILQSVGISLYNSLLATIGRKVFRQLEKDVLIIKRNVEFFFKGPLEALEELGRTHPNEKMPSLLLGYTS